jgi:hypothetical protein
MYAAFAVLVLFAILRPFGAFAKTGTAPAIFLLALGVLGAWLSSVITRHIVSAAITPKGETGFSEWQSSKGYQLMLQDGFRGGMKYDYRRNAWEMVNAQGVAARHGSASPGSVLMNLFWVALFILAIGFKFCL